MILEKDGLSLELLRELSYQTSLDVSLKKNLHYFEHKMLMSDIEKYIEYLDNTELLQQIRMDYRIKSMQSVEYKYKRYYPEHQTRKVFNDILGFRGLCDNYTEVLALEKNENIRIADMTQGKANDDGYRGVHVYFQVDNSYYPIEIQYNTFYDRQLNNWLHKYIYKKKDYNSELGKAMRQNYESGNIKTETEFMEVLNHVLSNS
ncbi:MAG: hypothetical protein R3Y24_11925 [Eubacteriales bacterium]